MSSGMIRLSKLMADRGLCSRREADRFIERRLVSVDGRIVDRLGTKVDPQCAIVLADSARTRQPVTILVNKPVGWVSGQAEGGYRPAAALVTAARRWPRDHSDMRFSRRHLKGLAPAGRLDIDSRGLLVLTQDGRIARQLIGPRSRVEKEYLVRVRGQVSDRALRLLRHGLELDGRPLRPARVDELNGDQLRFVLNEGRKRQIRRMCEQVDLSVTGLKRVRIGRVRLAGLAEGQWRYLGAGESF